MSTRTVARADRGVALRSPVVPRSRANEPILHVDLDAFYASVEVLKDPSLTGKPVVVGGAGTRGVVMSASYEARAFGIRSAMPAVRARRLCPDAVFVPPDFESYKAHSNRFREILLAVTPLVEPIALDEAFLDVSGATILFGEPADIAGKVRREVHDGLGVTCSVGVGPSKLVAKLASRDAKPDGSVVVRAGEVRDFLDPLPAARAVGRGREDDGDPRSARCSHRRRSRAHAAGGARPAHRRRSTPATCTSSPWASTSGRSSRTSRRSRSATRRPSTATSTTNGSCSGRRSRSPSGWRLGCASDGYRAKTITLKVRLANFTTLTRARTLGEPTDVAADLYQVVSELFGALPGARRRVRLLGVAATGLVTAGEEQLALLRGERWGDVERAVDRIERRFGPGSAMPAALLGRREPALRKHLLSYAAPFL